MKYLIHRTLLICALAHAGTVFAQVPSTNDTSDGNYNTGTGTGALGGPATSNHGQYNTAAGYQAAQETTGVSNTAFGYQALLHNSYWNGTPPLDLKRFILVARASIPESGRERSTGTRSAPTTLPSGHRPSGIVMAITARARGTVRS